MPRSPNSNNLTGLYFLLAFVFLISALMWFYAQQVQLKKASMPQTPQTQMISASYKCAGGETFQAVFVNGGANSVELNYADGTSFNLAQTISADGGRYANWDNSYVFWSKGDTAFIEENGKTTLNNCVQEKQ